MGLRISIKFVRLPKYGIFGFIFKRRLIRAPIGCRVGESEAGLGPDQGLWGEGRTGGHGIPWYIPLPLHVFPVYRFVLFPEQHRVLAPDPPSSQEYGKDDDDNDKDQPGEILLDRRQDLVKD
jgi:hypothetical protein